MKNAILGLHHVGLPSQREQWGAIRAHWEEMGLDVWEITVEDPDYDEHGAGPRLQVGKGTRSFISYFIGTGPGHIAFQLSVADIDWARESHRTIGETHWGHSVTSFFHEAPDCTPVHPGVELVTTDPGFHQD